MVGARGLRGAARGAAAGRDVDIPRDRRRRNFDDVLRKCSEPLRKNFDEMFRDAPAPAHREQACSPLEGAALRPPRRTRMDARHAKTTSPESNCWQICFVTFVVTQKKGSQQSSTSRVARRFRRTRLRRASPFAKSSESESESDSSDQAVASSRRAGGVQAFARFLLTDLENIVPSKIDSRGTVSDQRMQPGFMSVAAIPAAATAAASSRSSSRTGSAYLRTLYGADAVRAAGDATGRRRG